MMITKKIFKAIIGMTVLASLLSIFGCAFGPRGIAIVDLDTMQTRRIRPQGQRFERILSVKDDRFYTWQYTDDLLILRARDFHGSKITEKWLPLFDTGLTMSDKTISDDGNRLVSFEMASGALKMWDLTDNSELTLLPEVGIFSIRIVDFISDDEILIAVDREPEFGRDEAQILKYHIPSETLEVVKTIHTLALEKVSLSPSGRFLAFISFGIPKNLAVLDLETGGIVENQINDPENTDIVGVFSWSPDETKIAYSGAHRAHRARSIYVYNTSEQQSTVVRQFDYELSCYPLSFTDNQHLIFRIASSSRDKPKDNPLMIANIESGEIVKTIHIPYWGDLSVANSGSHIIFVYQ